MSLDDVKGEIRGAIAAQRYRDSAKSVQGGAVFSDAYFNPPGAPVARPQRNRREQRPSSPRDQNQN